MNNPIQLTDGQFGQVKELMLRANPPEVMDVHEAAIFLNMGESTIYKKVEEGSIPCHRDGRSIRFHLPEIRAWLKENKIESPEDAARRADGRRS